MERPLVLSGFSKSSSGMSTAEVAKGLGHLLTSKT